MTENFSAFRLIVIVGSSLMLCASALAQFTDSNELNRQIERLYLEGKSGEAIPLAEQSLRTTRAAKGEDHLETAARLDWLARLYMSVSRHDEVEPLRRRSLEIKTRLLPADDPQTAESMNDLASLFQVQGRFAEAEIMMQGAFEIYQKALSEGDSKLTQGLRALAASYNNLAFRYSRRGRFSEEERFYNRAIELTEQALGPSHAETAIGLGNLAAVLHKRGRPAEAELLMKRALAIYERQTDSKILLAGQLLALANLCWDQGRLAEAEAHYQRALDVRAIGRRSGRADVARILNSLGALYRDQGRLADAEPLIMEALKIRQNKLLPDDPAIAESLTSLALLKKDQGHLAEAERLLQRALVMQEKKMPADHPAIARTLSNLAGRSQERGDWGAALAHARRASAIIVQRHMRASTAADIGTMEGTARAELEQNRSSFRWLVRAAWRLAEREPIGRAELTDEAFIAGQWLGKTLAEAAVAQMAARQATGDTTLARLVRERQDLAADWEAHDKLLIGVRSRPADQRDALSEKVQAGQRAAITGRIAEIDSKLSKDFPDYAALASLKPLSIAEVQSQLTHGEALALFLDTPESKPTPEETFIWVVTKTDSRWVRSDLGTKALGERVAALRCGLDSTNWTDASGWSEATEVARRRKEAQIAHRERCMTLTGADVTDEAAPPFDVAKANELYQSLFGQFEDLLKNPDGTARQLLVVPSGALTQIPFQVLVTEKSDAAKATDYRNAAWLVRRHAITVLPSVASLKALRQNAKASSAALPFVGFGNPLVTGWDGNDKSAWARQKCPREGPKPKAVVVAGWTLPETFVRLFRGSLADLAVLRRQAPLPETADELCAVAHELDASDSDVNLGSRASETRIKELNADGALVQARVVHFATHGLIASETESFAKSLAEPALLLTPPDAATATDDGLLTASEVTELKLNADWIVLSACNTAAAGEKGNAEALSGLARAFFYAGARALLVSHWYVDSHAAVKITTGAFAEWKRNSAIGRAEALRRSLLAAMVDSSRPTDWTPAAHPAVWAPFVVVGEGGARR